RVGFDETGIGYRLRNTVFPDLVPLAADDVFREIRLIKTPDEIALLTQSAQINERAGRTMYEACRPGALWDDIVREYAVALAREGAIQEFVSTARGQESSMIF